jgi:multicomponent Na+:H+ antiporter subunit F
MTLFLSLVAVLLILLLGLGLWRVYLGPEEGDRMLAVQLLGSTTVGILVLLATLLDQPALLHVALLFALLAVLVAVAFVRRGSGASAQEGE